MSPKPKEIMITLREETTEEDIRIKEGITSKIDRVEVAIQANPKEEHM